MRITQELISALWIKLKRFGVPLDVPANVHCDNKGVVQNMSIPESALSKKHSAINYHLIQESIAAGILHIGKEDTQTNIVDAFTKLLPYSQKYQLLRGVLLDK